MNYSFQKGFKVGIFINKNNDKVVLCSKPIFHCAHAIVIGSYNCSFALREQEEDRSRGQKYSSNMHYVFIYIYSVFILMFVDCA